VKTYFKVKPSFIIYVFLFPFAGMAVKDTSVKLIYDEYKKVNKKVTQFKIQLVKLYTLILQMYRHTHACKI
jgi:hypothetical protein